MSMFDKDNAPLDDPAALAEHIESALRVQEPHGIELELAYRMVKRLFRPVLSGTQNIPPGPCLFVGNHSLFALDGWVLGPVMQKELGRFVRGLGDKFLFASPKVANFVMQRGGVMGHPDVCSALMQDGQDIIVFPGGAQEAVKPVSERYELRWKERYGFVRLAARHGYTIVPLGLVGPEEFYGHYIEGQDLPDSLPGRVLKRLGLIDESFRSDILPPIPIGALGTPMPKPQRCYIGFGQAIDLSGEKGKRPGKRRLHAIRAQVADEIETQLAELLFQREQRKDEDSLLRKILTL